MKPPRSIAVGALLVVASAGFVGCMSAPVPPALVSYATTILPARNAGGYSFLTPELRGELVLQDSAAACSVAIAQGERETANPACVCAHSSQADWQSRCQAWFQGASGQGLVSDADGGASVKDAGGGGG